MGERPQFINLANPLSFVLLQGTHLLIIHLI